MEDEAASSDDFSPPGIIPVGSDIAVGDLSERDRDILACERRQWASTGAKEHAIRQSFGMSVVRYYQVLNALLDNPSVEAYDPVLVKRLRRLRSRR